MDKAIAIQRLNREIRNCKKCPLWKTRKNAVPGEGLLNAKIMIIGQAPGSEENKTGRPFVGRAGQFLNQLLKTVKIKREKVFITSPIKCFPSKNRKPKKEEINACLPYLKKQIEIINPPKFILLGEVAFKIFFSDKKLKNCRGKVITLRPIQQVQGRPEVFEGRQAQGKKKYFITYHPAAGLRFPKIKKILEKDFKKLKNLK